MDAVSCVSAWNGHAQKDGRGGPSHIHEAQHFLPSLDDLPRAQLEGDRFPARRIARVKNLAVREKPTNNKNSSFRAYGEKRARFKLLHTCKNDPVLIPSNFVSKNAGAVLKGYTRVPGVMLSLAATAPSLQELGGFRVGGAQR